MLLKNLNIATLSHDGRGIGFSASGQPVFVSGALPGDIVDCELERDKKSWLEASLLGIITSKLPQSSPLCPHHALCGGCQLARMPYKEQLLWKKNIAANALRRIGGLDAGLVEAAWTQTIPSPKLALFRNKVEFAFGRNATGALTAGFRQKGSHTIAPVPNCALVDGVALEIARAAAIFAAQGTLPPYEKRAGFWRFLTLRHGINPENREEGWLAICLTSRANRNERKIAAALGEKLMADFPRLFMFIHEERLANDYFARGQKRIRVLKKSCARRQDAAFCLPLSNRDFLLDAASFFQVNSGAAGHLAQTVLSLDKPGGGLLDLYCGVGAPGQLLAGAHDRVLGIELEAKSVKYARINGAGLQNAAYITGPVAKILKRKEAASAAWPVILADPPRAGIGGEALETILNLGAERLIYVSCDSATLARDSRAINKKYRLASLTGVDLFPHTPHLECCSLWVKRD